MVSQVVPLRVKAWVLKRLAREMGIDAREAVIFHFQVFDIWCSLIPVCWNPGGRVFILPSAGRGCFLDHPHAREPSTGNDRENSISDP